MAGLKWGSRMKLKIVVACLATMFSAQVFADTNLVGTWQFVGRACVSGVTPNPEIPMPEGSVSFTTNTMQFSGPVEHGCTIVVGPEAITIQNGTVTPVKANGTLVHTCPNGTVTSQAITNVSFSYVVQAEALTLTTPPTEWEGSTCPKGDSQILTFVRTN